MENDVENELQKKLDRNGFTADKIDDYIWLGDITSALDYEKLDDLNITHILTVLDFDIGRPIDDKRIRKHVKAYDFHKTDLISEFESCYQFIDNAIHQKQNILIHCHAGMSRSATIACAYLMKKHNLSYKTAIERIRKVRPCVEPNPGFASQLNLYHSMNYSYNKDNSSENKSPNSYSTLIENNSDSTYSIEYKCKLCRQILFTDIDRLLHVVGKGRFDIQSRSSAYKAKQNAESKQDDYCQQELFILQPNWLTNIYEKDTNDGEILCPNEKCRAKLGRYSLIGEKCTCAKWVNPAFHFHRSKIDECPIIEKEQIEKYILKHNIT